MTLTDTRPPTTTTLPPGTAPRTPGVPGPGRTLRVVVGADTFAPDVNGAARFAERLSVGLAGRGHDVHVVSPSPDGRPRTEQLGPVTVHRVASVRTPVHETFRVARPWRVAGDVRRLLRRLAPDVVHPQSHFPVSRSLAAAAASDGTALVMTNHFMPENLFGHARVPDALQRAASAWAWRDLARVFARAQVVTAPTPRAVALLETAGGVRAALAVSCGIDLAGYGRPEHATEHATEPATEHATGRARDGDRWSGPDAPTVLFVGRLDEEKRVGELVRALALLPASVPARLDVVGEGTCRREWGRLAADLGVGDRVRFLGRVDEAALRRAYAGCAVFCMPGVAELQSLATLEAMASGAPVVVADAMALPHLVEQGRNGWLYPPGDVPALADRLARVLVDPAGAREMGRHSRRLAERHDLAATLDAFEALYATALDRAGSRGRPVRA